MLQKFGVGAGAVVVTAAPYSASMANSMATTGKLRSDLIAIANEALRSQPGCETARIVALAPLPHAYAGRNWEIPHVVLGDSLISDVDRAVMSVHHQLGRRFHLVGDECPLSEVRDPSPS